MRDDRHSEWSIVTLNDLGEVNRGRSRVRPRNAPYLYGGKYPFVQTGDITASTGRVSSYTQTYSDAGLAQSRLWPAGTMCITIAANIAETGILQFPACFPDSVVGFIPDKTKADVNFVEYMFRQLKRNIQLEATGSVQDNINLATLARLEFPLPLIGEQRAIAEVLGALDDKIAANTKLVDTSDTLAASMTRSALDFSRRVALSSIAILTMGSSPIGASFNESAQGTVFYQGVRDFGVRYPSNRIWTTRPVRLARPLDSLLSVRAPVGKVNLASEETCIGRGLASVRSRDSHPYTLFHILQDDPEAWAPYEAEGTVFGSINKNQLEALTVPIVPSGRVDSLEKQLAALEIRIAMSLEENVTLAATRDALLPQLMSGKLRVRDVERILEDAGV